MDERDVLLGYRPWLGGVARRMCQAHPWDAEDLAQEGWVALWAAIGTYDGSSPLHCWLQLSAVNRMRTVDRLSMAVCRDRRRSSERPLPAEYEPVWARRSPGMRSAELVRHHPEIHRAVQDLTPGERDWVFARYWTDAPATVGTSRATGCHARRKLAVALAHLHDAW